MSHTTHTPNATPSPSYPDTPLATELDRITAEYQRRAHDTTIGDRYSLFNPAALYSVHSLERALLAALRRHHLTQLASARILDVGCGGGFHARRFIEYGATPANITGLDLIPQRITHARARHPTITWQLGDAHQLPYPDASFQLITSFVVFSSLLDPTLRRRVADEMWRVCAPDGLILIYDFAYSNRNNTAVRSVPAAELRRLFPHPTARLASHRLTLAPPLMRRIAPHSHWLATTLEHTRLLNTHLLTEITHLAQHP